MILRGVSWGPVLAATALGAAILACCVAFVGEDPPLMYVRLALVALAGATAFVLDEPAAAAADSTPTTLRLRTIFRLAAGAMPFVVWVVGVLAIDGRSPLTPGGHLLVEGAGVMAVTVAAAAVLRRAGSGEPGEGVAVVVGGAILGLVAVNPPPRSVPFFPTDAGWTASTILWSVLGLTAALVVVAATRDPAASVRPRADLRGRQSVPTSSERVDS